MPSRAPAEYHDQQEAAEWYEPRMAARAERAAQRVRESVTINDIALALATGDVRRVMELFPRDSVREAFEPLGTLSRDAFARGGRLGAKRVREAAE